MGEKISSQGLADLIVDALVDKGFIEADDFAEASQVAKVEIDVRKALGDY
jgi:hypothetical protein